MSGLLAKGTTLWALSAVALSGYVAYGLSREPATLPADSAVPAATMAADGLDEMDVTAGLPSDDLVDRITARPLFSPTRRQQPSDTLPRPISPAPADDKPSLELIGTMQAGDAFIALLKHPSEGVLRRRPGDEVGDWQVIDVKAGSVSLESEGDVDVLKLREDRSPPPKRRVIRKEGEARDMNATTPERPVDLPPPAAAPIRRRI